MKFVVDPLPYTLFSEIYQKEVAPKARRKAFFILECAIQCLARKGFDGVTLEMIAREATVTRPLIKYYFIDIDDLLTMAIKYIRLHFQQMVLEHMQKATGEDKMLELYVEACFLWVEHFRTRALVWLAFLHRCARDKEFRHLNTMAVATGEARIAALLESGKKRGGF